MDKYKNILFENPRPFIIAQLENDRLIINETNISHEKNEKTERACLHHLIRHFHTGFSAHSP